MSSIILEFESETFDNLQVIIAKHTRHYVTCARYNLIFSSRVGFTAVSNMIAHFV
jgi:hypothetical protein